MTDTITGLHYAAIAALETYLIYSRTALKNARQELWRSVRK